MNYVYYKMILSNKISMISCYQPDGEFLKVCEFFNIDDIPFEIAVFPDFSFMHKIELEEFREIMNKENLGIPTNQPLADLHQPNQHSPHL